MEKEKYKETFKRVELPKDENPQYFHLNCPSCDSPVPADDINIQKNTAKCSSCNAIFSFKNSFPESTDPLKKPVGVEKFYFNKDLELSIPEPMGVINTIVLTLFPFIVVFGILIYFKKGGAEVAIGTGIVASILAYVIFRVFRYKKNKVHFVANEDILEVDWSMNSMIKSKEFKTSEIEQIYTTRTHNGIALKVILNTSKGQEHRILIDYMKSVNIAKYIEQEIEKHLGIKNKKVANEL